MKNKELVNFLKNKLKKINVIDDKELKKSLSDVPTLYKLIKKTFEHEKNITKAK